MQSASPARPPIGAAHVLVPLGAALCLLPWASTAAGLIAGIAIALVFGNPYAALTRRATHLLLTAAIVGLGAGMDLRVIARVGAGGALYTAAGIGLCLLLGALLARLLRVPAPVSTLITVGTAICGGSAIAAVVPILRPKESETSVALGTVFLLNSVALLLFPAIGHALALPQARFGLWAALAIHDTSSVVGAALSYGAQALEVATTVKLARALWIVPLALGIGAWEARKDRRAAQGQGQGQGQVQGKTRRPWFILGFLIAAALCTYVPALRPAGAALSLLARRAMVLTLFLIGTNLSREALRSVGARPLALGLLLWLLMAGLSLGAVLLGLAR